MTFDQFEASLTGATPPTGLSTPLVALWHDAKGDWNTSHNLAQEVEDADGAWVHAYLHRKEGDAANARYWYHRAGLPSSAASLNEEWEEIVRALLLRD